MFSKVENTLPKHEFHHIWSNLPWQRCKNCTFCNFHPVLTQPWNLAHKSFRMLGSTCCMLSDMSNVDNLKFVPKSLNQSYDIRLVNFKKWQFCLLTVLTENTRIPKHEFHYFWSKPWERCKNCSFFVEPTEGMGRLRETNVVRLDVRLVVRP